MALPLVALQGRTALSPWFALVLIACGPGPLPVENPPTTLSAPLEPMPVQVESTVQAEVKGTQPAASPIPPSVSELQLPPSLGFKTPESVLYDATADVYLVANINGSPTGLDNNGFVSQVNPDGTIRQLAFIAGGKNGVTLNAPKGMTIDGSTLYVADVNAVRRFDTATGKPLSDIALPKSTFVNDITLAPGGTLFVSDSGLTFRDGKLAPTGTDAIYRIDGDRVSVVAAGKQLEQPNGLLYADGKLLCASFASNRLRQLSLTGQVLATVSLPGGTLDGIVTLPDGQIVVSSWEKQSLYVGSLANGFRVLRENLAAPADIGVDVGRNRLLIPLFLNDELRFVDNSYSGSAPTVSSVALAPQL